MIYSYNKLWKMLIDKNMTKTEFRLKAGVSTNIIAKMGKGEPISMDNLAKIAITLDCGFDDIVEIVNTRSKEEQEDAYDLQCCLDCECQ